MWEQYRQYEDTLLQTIKEKLAEEDCSDKEFLQDLYNKQRSRVEGLFQRQLAVPLAGEELSGRYFMEVASGSSRRLGVNHPKIQPCLDTRPY